MKKLIALAVIVFFVFANADSALAHRRGRGGGGTNWGAVAGIGILAAIIGYVASRKGDIQEKGIDEEYRTQRYKIDADTTLAAPSALGDRESSEWDHSREGRARIYSPLPVRYSSSSVALEKSPRLNDLDADSGDDEDVEKKSTVGLPDITDLESLYRSLAKFEATKQELQALLHGIEEVRDTSKAEFSRRQLRGDLDSLHSLQEKILNKGGPLIEVVALEKLIKYVEAIVSRKEVS